MGHMIEKEAVYFTREDGTKIRIADVSFMFSPSQLGENFQAWHNIQNQFPAEIDGNTRKIYAAMDEGGKFTPTSRPLGYIHDGVFHLTGDVRMVDSNDQFIGKKVYTSKTTSIQDWNSYNPDGLYRKSDGFNIPTITEMGDIVGKHVNIPVTTAGRLGVGGSRGFFASHRLPKMLNPNVAELLGTQAHSFLTVFMDWSSGQVYTVNSQVMAVCYNTVMASLGSAVSTFYINLESNDPIRQLDNGLTGILDIAFRNADELNTVLPEMVETPIYEDQVEELAKTLFGGDVETNLSLGSEKSKVEERYNRNLIETERRKVMRNEIHQIFREGHNNTIAKRFGVTPQSEGTVFGAFQVVTGVLNYQPTRNKNNQNGGFAGMMIGTRANTNRQLFVKAASFAGITAGENILAGVTW